MDKIYRLSNEEIYKFTKEHFDLEKLFHGQNFQLFCERLKGINDNGGICFFDYYGNNKIEMYFNEFSLNMNENCKLIAKKDPVWILKDYLELMLKKYRDDPDYAMGLKEEIGLE